METTASIASVRSAADEQMLRYAGPTYPLRGFSSPTRRLANEGPQPLGEILPELVARYIRRMGRTTTTARTA